MNIAAIILAAAASSAVAPIAPPQTEGVVNTAPPTFTVEPSPTVSWAAWITLPDGETMAAPAADKASCIAIISDLLDMPDGPVFAGCQRVVE